MVWIVILIVPYGLLISETGINLMWATLSTQVLTSPFLVPLFLTVTWSKATAKGVISGNSLIYTFINYHLYTYVCDHITFYDR